MKKGLRIAAGLIASAVCLRFAFRGFDFATLRNEAVGFSLGWTVPAAALFLFSFVLRSARWRWILSSIHPVRFWTVAPVLVFGFFMNSVLPARGGELARAVAISRKSSIPMSAALGTIVAERTMDLVGMLTMMIVAARLLPWERLPIKPILITIGILIGVMAACIVVLPRLKGGGSAFAQKVISFTSQLINGFSIIRNPLKLGALLLVSIFIWIVDATGVLILSRVSGLDFVPTQAAALIVGIAVGVMIPAAPGYVGTFEFFGKQTLVAIGFEEAASLAFVVFLHFFQLVMIFLIGVPSTLSLGLGRGPERNAES